MRLAYADPPYPGRGHLYDENEDIDHEALVRQLQQFDGWALSTDSVSLRYVMQFCPDEVRVGAWVRTNAPPFNPDGRGAVRSWEPVVYIPARVSEKNASDRVRDVLHAHVPNGPLYNGIIGTKPPAFARWLFALMGASIEDDLADLFAGSGAITAAWQEWQRQPSLLSGALGGRRAGEHPSRKDKLDQFQFGEEAA